MAETAADLRVRIGAETAGAVRGINDVSHRLGSMAGGAVTAGAKITAAMGAVAGASVIAVAKVGLGYENMKEQSQIAFTTMLGSGKKATKMLRDLESFAKRTPFSMEDVTMGSQRLIAMGFAAKDVIPTMTAIGDAVAGLGGGSQQIDQVVRSLGQMQAKGKVQAEEMMQLTETGIPAWKLLAKTLGVDVATAMEMVSKGQVKAADAIPGLVKGMEKQFGGLMDKQADTLGGMWSTFKDSSKAAAGSLVRSFTPAFKDVMAKGTEFVDRIAKAKTWNQRIAIVWDGLKDAASAIWNGLSNLLSGVDWGSLASTVVTGLGNIRAALVNWIGTVDWVGIAQGAFQLLGQALSQAAELLRSINWGAVGATLGRLGQTIFDGLADLAPKIISGIGEAVKGIGRALAAVDWGAVARSFGNALRQTIIAAVDVLRSIDWGALLRGTINALGNAVKGLIDGLFPGLRSKVGEWIDNAKNAIVDRVLGWYNSAKDLGSKVVNGVRDGVKDVVSKVADKLIEIGQAVVGYFQTAYNAAKGLGTRVVKGVREGIGDILGAVWQKMLDIGRAISDFVGSAASRAYNLGKSIFDGILSALDGLGGAIYDKIGSAIDVSFGGLRSKLKSKSPSRVAADQLGKPIGDGIVVGTVEGLEPLGETMAGMVFRAIQKTTEVAKTVASRFKDEAGKPLGRAIVEGYVLGSGELPDKVGDSVRKALDRARSEVERGRGRLESTFGNLASRIGRAFDAETNAHLTPAEKELAAIDKRRRDEDMAQAITDAEANLARVKGTEGATPEEIAAAERALARAREDARVEGLRSVADAERREYESSREEERGRMEQSLADLVKSLGEKGAKAGEARTKLAAIMAQFGVDMQADGLLIGQAFAQGMDDAMREVGNSAARLRALVRSILGGGGKGKGKGVGPQPDNGKATGLAPDSYGPAGAGGNTVNVYTQGILGLTPDQLVQIVQDGMTKAGRRNVTVLSGPGVTA